MDGIWSCALLKFPSPCVCLTSNSATEPLRFAIVLTQEPPPPFLVLLVRGYRGVSPLERTFLLVPQRQLPGCMAAQPGQMFSSGKRYSLGRRGAPRAVLSGGRRILATLPLLDTIHFFLRSDRRFFSRECLAADATPDSSAPLSAMPSATRRAEPARMRSSCASCAIVSMARTCPPAADCDFGGCGDSPAWAAVRAGEEAGAEVRSLRRSCSERGLPDAAVGAVGARRPPCCARGCAGKTKWLGLPGK